MWVKVLLKLIPLITLAFGLRSGAKKFGPVFNVLNVTATQYELTQMINLIGKEWVYTKKDYVTDFPSVIDEIYTNPYTPVLRSFLGEEVSASFAFDIWGNPIEIFVDQDYFLVVRSSGPDGKWDNADDVLVEIELPKKAAKKLIQLAQKKGGWKTAKRPMGDSGDLFD